MDFSSYAMVKTLVSLKLDGLQNGLSCCKFNVYFCLGCVSKIMAHLRV